MPALETFVEPFRALNPAVWQFTAGQAAIVAGRLQITPPFLDFSDLTAARHPGEVWSVAGWDLRGSHLTLELPAINGAASGVTEAGLFVTSPRTTALGWQVLFDPGSVWGWQLRAVHRTAGAETVVASLYLDSQEQRWLRISEDAGTVTWATSPDGFTWTQRATAAAVPAGETAAVRIYLGNRYTSPGDVQQSAQFDSLNVDLTAADPVTLTGDDGLPYLAVDVQPDNITGAFRVGTSTIGGPDRLAWSLDDPSTWVNVVCDVRSVDYQRGAPQALGVLTVTEAGTATVLLSDVAGRFDPNLAGESIRKGTPARLRAWGTDVNGGRWDAVLFTGELDTATAQYVPDEDAPLVTLTLQDAVGPLTAWESEGAAGDGAGAGDTLLQRARRILATVGRGEVSSASSTSYTATLAPTPLQQAWDELQRATVAELGRLWVDRHNRLQLRARGSQPSGPVRGTLSDVHGEAPLGVHGCMADASITRGGAGLVNRVLARRVKLAADTDVAQARRDDEPSQRLYGVASVSRQDLLLQTDAQAAAWAGALITARTRPELRVDSVTPAPPPGDLGAALEQWPAVCGTDVGDRWLFRFHPPVGPPIIRGLAVVGITGQLSPAGWSFSWTTEPAAVPGAANPTGWFVLGLSTIGGSDLLAPYALPYAAA